MVGNGPTGDAHRRQIRAMFNWAERQACRHQTVARYFGDELDRCETSCDFCTDIDLLEGLIAKPKAGKMFSSQSPVAATTSSPLFEDLKALRRELADARGVPAYIVFSDATLLAMAASKPQNEAELLNVSGVGPTKLETYGEAFLEVLRAAE